MQPGADQHQQRAGRLVRLHRPLVAPGLQQARQDQAQDEGKALLDRAGRLVHQCRQNATDRLGGNGNPRLPRPVVVLVVRVVLRFVAAAAYCCSTTAAGQKVLRGRYPQGERRKDAHLHGKKVGVAVVMLCRRHLEALLRKGTRETAQTSGRQARQDAQDKHAVVVLLFSSVSCCCCWLVVIVVVLVVGFFDDHTVEDV